MEVTFNHNRQLLIRYAAALIKILSYNKYISEFQTYMDYKDCANKDWNLFESPQGLILKYK